MVLWPFSLFRVSGDSMLPTYRHGDTLLGLRWFEPHPGQVVVAHNNHRLIIKRVASVQGSLVGLLGDNPKYSTDSRSFGAISRVQVIARIITKL